MAAERENIGLRYTEWYANTTSAAPVYTASIALAIAETNGMPGPFQYVRCGMPSDDWMYVGFAPTRPLISAASIPASLIAATHASSASDAGVTSPLVAPEAGGGRARERDLILGRVGVADHAAPASLNAGNGRPSRSIQVSSTGVPMTMSSFDASTTVLVNRRPSCSSSSTVTTGCGPAW